eukprot:11159164-Lingulodinium_polyedra.AAC.1
MRDITGRTYDVDSLAIQPSAREQTRRRVGVSQFPYSLQIGSWPAVCREFVGGFVGSLPGVVRELVWGLFAGRL